MDVALACRALRSRKRLSLRYNGFVRVVEVHAAGQTSEGRPAMLVWQVRGGSNSGRPTGWRLLRIAEVTGETMLEETSQAPRPSYHGACKILAVIVCKL